jgi:hypothetical protein
MVTSEKARKQMRIMMDETRAGEEFTCFLALSLRVFLIERGA